MLCRSATVITLLPLLAAAGAPVVAAEWSFSTPARVSADYSDNRELVAQANSSAGLAIVAEPSLSRSDERSRLSLAPRLLWQTFSGSSQPDSKDIGMTASYQINFERASFDAAMTSLSESSSSFRRTETALVESGNDRRTDSQSAALTASLTQRSRARLEFSRAEISFENDQFGNLPGYDYQSANLTLTHAPNARTSFGLLAGLSNLSRRRGLPGLQDHSLQLSLERQLSLNTAVVFAGGGSRSELASGDGTDWVGSLQMRHQTATSSWSIEFARAAVPLARGTLVRRDRIAASADFQLSPRWLANLSIWQFRNQANDEDLRGERRRLAGAAAALQWRHTEQLRYELQLGANSGRESFSTDDHKAISMALNVIWSPNPRSWSR